MRKLAVSILLVCALSIAHAASEKGEVIREYVKHFNAGDWVSALALVDTEELQRMRAAFSKGLDQRPEQRNKAFKGLSLEEINQLNDAQYLGKALENTYNEQALGFEFTGPKYTIIGYVDEGNDRIHAVVRLETTTSDVTTTQVNVLVAQKQNDKWIIAPTTRTVQHPVTVPRPPVAPPPAPPRKTP